jgi:hypothetical protein
LVNSKHWIRMISKVAEMLAVLVGGEQQENAMKIEG